MVLALFLCFSTNLWAKEPLVYAASSLGPVMEAMQQAYLKQEGQGFRLSLSSSAGLARQIEQGAPAEIFFSAHPAWTQHLASQGLIERGEVIPLLANRLVLVTQRDSPLQEGQLVALLKKNFPGRLAICDPDLAPCGDYAVQALTKLGLWENLRKKAAYGNNARLVRAWVERGETSMGILYASDLVKNPNLRLLAYLNADLHQPIRYPLALLRGASEEARKLYHWLQGPEAATLFQSYGFILV